MQFSLSSSGKVFYSLLAAIALTLCLAALFTDGTAGNGDSLCHYLMAKGSWNNPVLFLDLWGKPVFTLLCSPFAQMGFKAVKVFNVLVMCAACWFSYLTAKRLELKYAAWVAVFFFFASETIEVTMSAFTEPVFALVMIAGIFFITDKKPVTGSIVLSFLPFARSEGLVILCAIVAYLLFTRSFKVLPYLLTGHVVLGLIGLPVYHDFFWFITHNPYAGKIATDGDRHWYYFLYKLYYLIGPASYLMLGVGFLSIIPLFLSNVKARINDEVFLQKVFLVAGTCAALVTAHSIFWATGMFASIGLTRVIICVIPSIALLCLMGLNVFLNLLEKPRTRYAGLLFEVLMLAAALYFTSGYAPTRMNYRDDFCLGEGQAYMTYQVAPYLNTKFPGYHPYVSDIGIAFLMNKNYYDSTAHALNVLYPLFKLGEKELIIWDDLFSKTFENIPLDTLMHKSYLKHDTSFIQPLTNGDTLHFSIFHKR